MPIRLQPRVQQAAMASVVCLALILAACTRSAGTSTVPTAGPTGVISSTDSAQQPSDQDATMAAIGTQVAGQLTQTAVAAGGGQPEGTPKAPGDTPAPGDTAVPQDTQQPIEQPTTAPGDTAVPQPTQVPAATPVPAGATCSNPYTVQSGDWIYKIARNCNVSVASLIAANPNINPNTLTPGQLLNMPSQQGPTPSTGDPQGSGCSGKHVVATGDTLYALAFACGLTVEQLAAQNGITYPYTIYIGQVLTI
jgi:LysM repeat protein